MASTKRLSQILAVEKTIKNKVNDEGAAIIKQFAKPDLFTGHTKTFEPLKEDSEQLAGETKVCQFNARKLYGQIRERMSELLDVTLTKDIGNTEAAGILNVVGKDYKLPVTYLIWVEKQLLDLQKVVASLPTLDPAHEWSYDPNKGMHRTVAVKSARNKPEKKAIVKYPATEQHPAQTEIIEQQVLQGYWSVVYTSTALPVEEKEALQSRVEQLLKAVKQSREEANTIKVEEQQFAAALFAFVEGK